MTARWIPATAIVLAAAWSPVSLAQEPVLFEEASSGILELSGHSSLEIEGFAGTVFVRAGKQGELRYSAATRTVKREPHPVALWLRGRKIIFRPVAGLETDELILEITLPEGLRLRIDHHGGKVQVASVLGDVSVRAVESEVDIRGAAEKVSVELEGGTLRLENLAGLATVSGTKVGTVHLVRLTGAVDLSLLESVIHASAISMLRLDLGNSTLEVEGSVGWISGNAIDSRLELVNVRGGGSLQLENTPLSIKRSRGSFEIDTDAEFTFRALQGTLKVTGFGGAVIGDGHSGEVIVVNRDARISLKNIGGPVVLNGQALKIELVEIRNTVTMHVVDSEVFAERVRGGFEVHNEFGDVSVKGVEGPTRITSRNGSVQARDLTGSVDIEAAGPEVRVEWKTIGRDGDSRIENSAGDVYVVFPAGAGAKVEAEADSIESDIEELRIGNDGRFANGLIGNMKTPTVTLRASGRLVISQLE